MVNSHASKATVNKLQWMPRILSTLLFFNLQIVVDAMKLGCNKGPALQTFFVKALSKRFLKLTIKTKLLSQLKSLSFFNFND